MWYAGLIERGVIPDALLRIGIRGQLASRLRLEAGRDEEEREQFFDDLSDGPIAVATYAANHQHYEVPPGFFEAVLGPHLKYSCGHWDDNTRSLGDSERAMLGLTCERAGVADGQTILDLGCGWGSLSVYMAERFPAARIVSVSNSRPQVATIQARAAAAGLDNLEARRADINEFDPPERFDRVVSIEMFEHMRNYRGLLRKISGWLAPGGRLFVHHFAHRRYAYPYDASDDNQWMARHFFTGGIMPAADTLSRFDDDLAVIDSWDVNGTHYHRTCEAWLANMHLDPEGTRAALADGGDPEAARHAWNMWRVFFLACSELFRYRGGEEWIVAHRLLAPCAEARRDAA